jgi:nitrogen regulatory protein PII
MKEIKAYIREDKMADVVRGLRRQGASGITVVRVVPMGSETDPEFVDISSAAPVEHYAPMLKVEVVCGDADAERFVETIRSDAYTGAPGDGIIFLSDVRHAVHIRSGTRDERAL